MPLVSAGYNRSNKCCIACYCIVIYYCEEVHKSINAHIHKISLQGGGLSISSRATSESGREFHKLIVDSKKEFKYVSFLVKGVMKCWLYPRVGVKRGVNVTETSTRPCNNI